jgi:hypothetical protein
MACGGFKYTTEKCHTPKHLVALYEKYQGSGSGYEAHFSIPTNSMFKVGCLSMDPENPSTNKPTLTADDYTDSDDTMVEYALNDMFGDLL